MFYESRLYKLHPVKDAKEGAELLFNRRIDWYQVPTWILATGEQMYLVTDGVLDSMFDEIAVLRRELDGLLYQVESLTLAWIKPESKFKEAVERAETAKTHGIAQLILGKPDPHITATFTCGCCGSSFTGIMLDQLAYDQDAGYGICPKCENYYG